MGLNAAASATTRLGSWTRTLNEDDALALLSIAQPGLLLAAWTGASHAQLPQGSFPRRREIVRIVCDELLDHDGEHIQDSSFLRLFHGGSPHRRRGLLYARLLRRRPWVDRALTTLVLPALERADQPLAPHDSDLIPTADWDTLLSAELGPNPPPESFLKTRSTLQAALASVGAIERSGSTVRVTRARHGRPDPLVWCWSLAVELRERGEQTEAVITRRCFASRLFTLRPEVIDGYVELGLSEGLLRRGYLMGQALLSAGEGLR